MYIGLVRTQFSGSHNLRTFWGLEFKPFVKLQQPNAGRGLYAKSHKYEKESWRIHLGSKVPVL